MIEYALGILIVVIVAGVWSYLKSPSRKTTELLGLGVNVDGSYFLPPPGSKRKD